jgi:hypothetical protein
MSQKLWNRAKVRRLTQIGAPPVTITAGDGLSNESIKAFDYRKAHWRRL